MIDEETLSSLFAEHALRIPVPEAGIDELLAQSPRAAGSVDATWTRRPPARLLAAAAIVLVVAGTGVAIAHSHHSHGTVSNSALTGGSAATAPLGPSSGASRAGVPANQQAYSLTAGGVSGLSGTTADHTATGSGGAKAAASTNATAPTDTAKVIRTGTLDLVIKRHTFGSVIGRITTISASEGGLVADASTNESAAIPSGTISVRVPSARFNDTVGKLRALGKVESATTRGSDVTGQYTDLQARLHAADAARDAYLAVLGRATNIGDILAVQDRIENVQTQIDQLQGQINGLDNQTTYATVTLSVAEPGPTPKPTPKPHHKPGLQVAWDNARDGFARRIEGLISHSGSALVILLGLAALIVALRLLVPRARRLFV